MNHQISEEDPQSQRIVSKEEYTHEDMSTKIQIKDFETYFSVAIENLQKILILVALILFIIYMGQLILGKCQINSVSRQDQTTDIQKNKYQRIQQIVSKEIHPQKNEYIEQQPVELILKKPKLQSKQKKTIFPIQKKNQMKALQQIELKHQNEMQNQNQNEIKMNERGKENAQIQNKQQKIKGVKDVKEKENEQKPTEKQKMNAAPSESKRGISQKRQRENKNLIIEQDDSLALNDGSSNSKEVKIHSPIDESDVKLKESFHLKRTAFFQDYYQQNKEYFYLPFAKYNQEFLKGNDPEKDSSFQKEKKAAQTMYSLSKYSKQAEICVIIYAGQSKKLYNHEYVLNSVLNQDYKNFKIVYIADGLSQEKIDRVELFIAQKNKESKITFESNKKKIGYLQTVFQSIKRNCGFNSITALMFADDELLGHQSFQILNAAYRQEKVNAIYTNSIVYSEVNNMIAFGAASRYSQEQKQANKYRELGPRFGHGLETFKTSLISFIKEEDLQDQNHNYLKVEGEIALYFPILELSCNQVIYLPEFNYLSWLDKVQPPKTERDIIFSKSILMKPRYKCFKEYR